MLHHVMESGNGNAQERKLLVDGILTPGGHSLVEMEGSARPHSMCRKKVFDSQV